MWDAELGCYRSRTGVAKGDPRKARDIAVVLAILHAGRETGTHSVLDPKAQATLATLEDLFDAEYALNQGQAEDRGPAMGRYPGDVYYSGGAWYVSTLAAAEFYFKLSTKLLSGADVASTSENARFRSRLPLDDGAAERRDGRGRPCARRRLHAHRARLHA